MATREKIIKKLCNLSDVKGACIHRKNKGKDVFIMRKGDESTTVILARDYYYQHSLISNEQVFEASLPYSAIKDIYIKQKDNKYKEKFTSRAGSEKSEFCLNLYMNGLGSRLTIPLEGDFSEPFVRMFNDEAYGRIRIYIGARKDANNNTCGYSYAITEKDVVTTRTENLENCGYNRACLMAAVEALETIQKKEHVSEDKITIYSTCSYLVLGYNYWISKWVAKDGKIDPEKKNIDLWEKILKLKEEINITVLEAVNKEDLRKIEELGVSCENG